ncbi:hypothetical protein CEN40_03250 [Fischerella thermalis CCMEE 5205]|uniref:Uncharacterized protein n=1 Tax=Chlorogloeopsis fritschii PCC 6912 TaxID=211165 RepID=A0A3S1AL73_CHLFR|nr:hypothetical protein [Chlorogloeopsis fritschii]PMB49958.1 hypothetical protein CEN40_03250 [Fischerella thermalis CCMEE 5205]RUR83666.1 hypothetical protein PCC6912_19090 [Chlorogloeopsis fritschii PCC 6912]
MAHFADAIRPEVRALRDIQARELGELVTRRRQVVEMITAEKACECWNDRCNATRYSSSHLMTQAAT